MEMSGCYTDFFLPSKFCIIMNTDLVHSFQFMLLDRKSTRLNSSHSQISYAVFCLKKKKKQPETITISLGIPVSTYLTIQFSTPRDNCAASRDCGDASRRTVTGCRTRHLSLHQSG